MALIKRGRFWHIYWKENGKIKSFSTGYTIKSEAEKIDLAKKKERQWKKTERQHKRIFGYDAEVVSPIPTEIVKQEHKRGSIRLDAMFDTALQYRKLSNTHKCIFDRFVKESGKTFADEITPKVALEYLRKKYGKGNGKSFNNAKTILNTIFKLCVIETGLSESPFERIMNMRVENVQHHRALTQDEFIRAFNAAEEPWKTASLIAWHTGARFETCKRIMEELLNNPSDDITIKPGKTSRFGRSVYIPIHPELRQWINGIIASGVDWKEWKFKKNAGNYKTGEQRTYYVHLLNSVGVNDTEEGKASFHSLRSSFITRCDEEKIDRKDTRGIVGQVADETTDLYSYDKEGAKAILNLPGLGIFDPKNDKKSI